jgi:hypothetical protein
MSPSAIVSTRVLRLAATLCLGAALVAPSGCSWATVTGPPPNAVPSPHPGCTTAQKPLTFDRVMAATFGLAGAGGLVAVAGGCQNVACVSVLFGGLLVALPFALSSDYGVKRIERCRAVDLTWRAQEQERELRRAPARRPPAPRPPSPPASPPASQPASRLASQPASQAAPPAPAPPPRP